MIRRVTRRVTLAVASLASLAALAGIGLATPAMAAPVPGSCTTTAVGAVDTAGGVSSACFTSASVAVTSAVTIADNTPSVTFAPGTPGGTSTSGAVNIVVTSNDALGYAVTAAVIASNNSTTPPTPQSAATAYCDFYPMGAPANTVPPVSQQVPFTGLTLKPNGAGGAAGGACTNNGSNFWFSAFASDAKASPSAPGGDSYGDVWTLAIPGGVIPGTYNAQLQYTVLGS